MLIKSSEFVKSSRNHFDCPQGDFAEVAFLGRSNVGKSSLINMLVGRKQLAATSQVPGKTRLINHFFINRSWHLVDLPGYGWAKISKSVKQHWDFTTADYLLHRKQLVTVVVLIDAKLPPQAIDLEVVEWLVKKNLNFCLVFTKVDKVSINFAKDNVNIFHEKILESCNRLPNVILCSSKTKLGQKEVLKYISSSISDYKNRLKLFPGLLILILSCFHVQVGLCLCL